MTKISIAIPCYEYNGKGVYCLEYSFKKLEKQTFKDFDVVISDHSKDNKIEKLCNLWKLKLNITYVRNEEKRGNPAQNLNIAIKNAKGDWIKILCQDDFLLDENSLSKTANGLDENHNWLATAYLHTNDRKSFHTAHFPFLNPQIYIVNTIGTPSCTIFRNIPNFPEFDESLSYCYDCEFYYRFFLKYGNPKMINETTIANFLWGNSITSMMTRDLIEKENLYILRKFGIVIE